MTPRPPTYGSNDDAQFTGIDKPDAADPTKEPYNAYRFNAKRWDQNSQSYDMGFRDYSPGLNRFLTRDSYNGALADMHLGLNPWTGNRYAFGGGNPISAVELDGHDCWSWAQDICDAAETAADWVNHNADTLQDLALDAAEVVLGAVATDIGIGLMASGVAACGVTVPAAVTGVGAVITAAGCGAGAALAGAGVLVAGVGLFAMADGGSKFWDDLHRLESTGNRSGEGKSRGDLGAGWKPQDPGDPKCFTGCEDVAKDIQKRLGGGQIYRLSNAENPPGKDNFYGLGPYMDKEQGWYTHDVVVYDGRVYDGFTDRMGVSMEEFESRWGYGADILKWMPIS